MTGKEKLLEMQSTNIRSNGIHSYEACILLCSFGYWWHLPYMYSHSCNQSEKEKNISLECVYIIYQIRLMSELSCCYLCNPCLQRGQHDIIFSHWSTHFWWNKWEQGSCLTSSLSLYLAKQMQHSCHHTHKLISSI